MLLLYIFHCLWSQWHNRDRVAAPKLIRATDLSYTQTLLARPVGIDRRAGADSRTGDVRARACKRGHVAVHPLSPILH